jgi:hypothetical protein
MIAALLLWVGHRRSALDALELFTFRRTADYDPEDGLDEASEDHGFRRDRHNQVRAYYACSSQCLDASMLKHMQWTLVYQKHHHKAILILGVYTYVLYIQIACTYVHTYTHLGML